MRLKNWTACAEAEAFIRQEIKAWQTTGLTVWLKYTRDRSAGLYGYFRDREIRILAAVNTNAALPALVRFSVRTRMLPIGDFRFGHDEEPAGSLDELMVWVFFHELHHFLCHTRQRSGDWETRANTYAFEMLRKFKAGRTGAAAQPSPPPGTVVRFRERVAGDGWPASDSPGLAAESPAPLSVGSERT